MIDGFSLDLNKIYILVILLLITVVTYYFYNEINILKNEIKSLKNIQLIPESQLQNNNPIGNIPMENNQFNNNNIPNPQMSFSNNSNYSEVTNPINNNLTEKNNSDHSDHSPHSDHSEHSDHSDPTHTESH